MRHVDEAGVRVDRGPLGSVHGGCSDGGGGQAGLYEDVALVGVAVDRCQRALAVHQRQPLTGAVFGEAGWSSPMYATTRPPLVTWMKAPSCFMRPRAVRFTGVEAGSNRSISTTHPKRWGSFGSSGPTTKRSSWVVQLFRSPPTP